MKVDELAQQNHQYVATFAEQARYEKLCSFSYCHIGKKHDGHAKTRLQGSTRQIPRGAEGSRSQRRSCHPKQRDASSQQHKQQESQQARISLETRSEFVAERLESLVVVKLLLSLVARVARLALVVMSKNVFAKSSRTLPGLAQDDLLCTGTKKIVSSSSSARHVHHAADLFETISTATATFTTSTVHCTRHASTVHCTRHATATPPFRHLCCLGLFRLSWVEHVLLVV